MKKKILIILGHTDSESFCSSLTDRYATGASKQGYELRRINLGEIKFDPILHLGYRKIQDLEPDLLKAQEDIRWADHLVIIFPNWWGTFPAILKGFIDRIFLPAFGYKFKSSTSFVWKKLLKNKTGRMIVTMDAPPIYYRFYLFSPGVRAIRKTVLEFCGISPVRTTLIGPIKKMSEKQKTSWLKRIEKLGKKGK